MPDQLNKQSVINLLIDSPLREPIKINLIDIVNNTNEPDLPKVYSTITKELEIFQKATERRMKLADETIAKLGGTIPSSEAQTPNVATGEVGQLPPLDLPPLPTPPTPISQIPTTPPLSVPPLDLPPLPTQAPSAPPASSSPAAAPMPPLEPLGAPVTGTASDEDALAEIQKELDSLKSEAAADVASAAAPTTPAPAPAPAQQ